MNKSYHNFLYITILLVNILEFTNGTMLPQIVGFDSYKIISRPACYNKKYMFDEYAVHPEVLVHDLNGIVVDTLNVMDDSMVGEETNYHERNVLGIETITFGIVMYYLDGIEIYEPNEQGKYVKVFALNVYGGDAIEAFGAQYKRIVFSYQESNTVETIVRESDGTWNHLPYESQVALNPEDLDGWFECTSYPCFDLKVDGTWLFVQYFFGNHVDQINAFKFNGAVWEPHGDIGIDAGERKRTYLSLSSKHLFFGLGGPSGEYDDEYYSEAPFYSGGFQTDEVYSEHYTPEESYSEGYSFGYVKELFRFLLFKESSSGGWEEDMYATNDVKSKVDSMESIIHAGVTSDNLIIVTTDYSGSGDSNTNHLFAYFFKFNDDTNTYTLTSKKQFAKHGPSKFYIQNKNAVVQVFGSRGTFYDTYVFEDVGETNAPTVSPTISPTTPYPTTTYPTPFATTFPTLNPTPFPTLN